VTKIITECIVYLKRQCFFFVRTFEKLPKNCDHAVGRQQILARTEKCPDYFKKFVSAAASQILFADVIHSVSNTRAKRSNNRAKKYSNNHAQKFK
jgi:hypothetical protein